MGGRIKLCAELICRQIIAGRLETLFLVMEGFALFRIGLDINSGLSLDEIRLPDPIQTGNSGVMTWLSSMYFAPLSASE